MSKFFHSHSEKEDAPPYPTPEPVAMQPAGNYIVPRGQFGITFACMLLSSSDKIRLIGFSQDVIPGVDMAITRVWAPGIQKKGQYVGGGYEWKLSGRPWYGQGSEAVPSRRLIAHILHSLANSGWHLSFSTDLSKKGWDKDTLYFKPGQPRSRFFFPVSFNEFDKIRLIDSPNPNVTQAFLSAVKSWPLGIQDEKQKEHGCIQLKLRGNPWCTSDGAEVNYARLLGCSILSALDANGFELIASIDMSAMSHGDSNRSELDTWFFADK